MRIIAAHPDKSRRFVSQEVCREWNWRQPNGVLKDMVCRSLLLLLESKGFIKLPARKCTPANPLANRKKPTRVVIDQTPVQCPIGDLFPVKLEQVRRTRFEKIFNGLVSEHHYLGYTQPVGEHLKYVAFSDGIGPTNNVAEQAIRFIVIDRHITQGTRSIKGRKSCERLWTVIATCVLQGRSAFNFILKAVKAYFQDQPSPSLLPGSL